MSTLRTEQEAGEISGLGEVHLAGSCDKNNRHLQLPPKQGEKGLEALLVSLRILEAEAKEPSVYHVDSHS